MLYFLNSSIIELFVKRKALDIHFKYCDYTERQSQEIESMQSSGKVELPKNWDYRNFSWLSLEERERLTATTPQTIEDLQNMRGIRPDTVMRLYVQARKAINSDAKTFQQQMRQ